MNKVETIKIASIGAVCVGIGLMVTLCGICSRERECVNRKVDDECSTNTAIAIEAIERPNEQTQKEEVEAEFRRIIYDVRAGDDDIEKMNQRISQMTNHQEALLMYDKLLEMAITHNVSSTNYNSRSAQYYKLWFAALYSFLGVQRRQGGDFSYWDKMFQFLSKYTDEITSVEKTLPLTDSRFWGRKDKDRGRYLLGIRGDFKTWVHVMRDFYFPELSKGLTEEQKADILRRLDEVKKYTVPPSHSPFNKMIPTQGGNDK